MNSPEAQAVRHALEYYAAAFGALALTPEVIERAALAATPAPAPHPDTQDAERYRWLMATNPALLLSVAWGKSPAAYAIGADCDAAIDAARGVGASTGGGNG